jgi:3',5'-cyclic AMP phosphodiesterase CpdA
MKRIIHLSDLHFGRDRPELLLPLVHAVTEVRPDLVIISGDLTQRATAPQFAAAASFIKSLDRPVLCVPGNHDVPLHNLFVRLFMPWRRYRRWINPDLEPTHADDEMVVIGVNTVNPFVWQQGWFRARAIRRVCAAFAGSTARRVHLVVVHHPMEHLPGERKSLMRGAATGIQHLSDCGADIVLSGHLHSWRAEPFSLVVGRPSALQVHAGTSLSNRLRGEVNDFNILEVEPTRVTVARHAFVDDAGGFRMISSRTFLRSEAGWAPGPAALHPPGRVGVTAGKTTRL